MGFGSTFGNSEDLENFNEEYWKNIKFGTELENLMEKYPEMKVFTTLNMAVKFLKTGKTATYNIRTDWDKYGRGNVFSPELNELCMKYGILNSEGMWI